MGLRDREGSKLNIIMRLTIKNIDKNNIENFPFELVERKGVGHPDTICDAIAETASRYYSLYFYEKYGRVANHWFDKVMLIGGEADIQLIASLNNLVAKSSP
tara:strand:+ start:2359 stop:2664 length:306 start_codon:yes stop_codon:yes gene_type:complete